MTKKKRRTIKQGNFYKKLQACISGTAKGTFFQFYMWVSQHEEQLHSKFCAIRMRHHKGTVQLSSKVMFAHVLARYV